MEITLQEILKNPEYLQKIEEMKKEAREHRAPEMPELPEAFDFLIAMAEGNDEKITALLPKLQDTREPRLLFLLGTIYMSGMYGAEKNEEKGLEFLTRAAESQNKEARESAEEWLSIYYDNRDDREKALYWSRKGAGDRIPSCMRALGYYYLDGIGVAQDKKKAKEWLTEAAKEGDGSACNLLMQESMEEHDINGALKWARKGAGLNDPSCLSFLGMQMIMSNSSKKKIAEAMDYLTSAGSLGEPEAMYLLGKIYAGDAKVKSVKKDVASAERWFRKAEEAGETDAVISRAAIYMEGKAARVDTEKAISILDEAIGKGNGNAALYLAICYANGTGVTKNLLKAQEYLNKAIFCGEEAGAAAQKLLAVLMAGNWDKEYRKIIVESEGDLEEIQMRLGM